MENELRQLPSYFRIVDGRWYQCCGARRQLLPFPSTPSPLNAPEREEPHAHCTPLISLPVRPPILPTAPDTAGPALLSTDPALAVTLVRPWLAFDVADAVPSLVFVAVDAAAFAASEVVDAFRKGGALRGQRVKRVGVGRNRALGAAAADIVREQEASVRGDCWIQGADGREGAWKLGVGGRAALSFFSFQVVQGGYGSGTCRGWGSGM